MVRIEQLSALASAAGAVWAQAVTEAGINDELSPILRMSMPAGLRGETVETVEVGVPLGRSWILLGGLIPVDYDDLRLVELEPGRRFLERSRTLSFSTWEHERVIEPVGEDACTVTDRLGFELKRPLAILPGSARLAAAIVKALFRHRHRRLARRWGQADPAVGRRI